MIKDGLVMEKNSEGLVRLLTKVYKEKGLDFTQYKKETILRRISIRVSRCGASTYDEYMKFLDMHPDEYNELINSVTINVTEFFRNPESFKVLEQIVIPRVIYSKREHKHKIIRAWSCGCSTGDEAYSLAILLLEKLGEAKSDFLLSIYGSDVDKTAIASARHTIYSKDKLKALNNNLLLKYFDYCGEDRYKLKSFLQEAVKFRELDIINNPPIMHCDIILCRNLLIYFNKQLQEEILLKFYEALNPGGFLILGMVESLAGSAEKLFEPTDSLLRIYRRPEENILSSQGSGILSQERIDNIVKEMLGKG